MNIYEPEGTDAIVDLRAAAVELRAAGSITSESARRAAIAEINTAALLDIALSLRVVAAEARAAMPDPRLVVDPDLTTDVEPEPAEDFVVKGDLVAVNGLDDPAEIVGFGQSEGAIYAKIRLVDGTETRAWLTDITRLRGDEHDDDAMQDASEAEYREIDPADADAIEAEARIIPDPADLVDDIDADFDGDHHPAAASALDVLKANEAERKAAKKGGSKKGKKS